MLVVLDASAVLALLHEERGWEEVKGLLPGALISAVNLLEVVTRLVDRGDSVAEAQEILGLFRLEVIPLTTELAYLAAELRPLTRRAGLSLGDRACLATAMSRNATAVTGDRAWAGLDLPVAVELFR